MRAFAVAWATCAVMTATAPCFAQAPAGSAGSVPDAPRVDAAAAQTLFAQGRALLEKGDVEPACAKFEESLAADRGAVGTLFNLALCNERRGRLATAWLQQSEVLAVSRATRPDRVALAEERIRALEPRLSRLSIAVPRESQVIGLSVAVDGAARSPSTYGTQIPIDGGEHVITATAKGHATYTTKVTAQTERGLLEVRIPRLERVANEPVQPAPEPVGSSEAPASDTVSPSTLGWVVGAAGVAVLAVGAGFGIVVFTQADDTKNQATPLSDRQSRYDALNREAWIANVAVPLGALITGAGAYLLWSNANKPSVSTPARPTAPASGPTVQGSARDVRVGWQASF